MKFSFLDTHKALTATCIPTTWEEFTQTLTSEPIQTDCEPCPGHECEAKRVSCWSPAEYRDGKRGNKNVVAVHALVYDVDGVTIEAIARISENLKAAGVGALIVGSHSYTDEKPSVRVVVRLTRAVLPHEYAFVWSKVKEDFEIPGDPAIKETDITRIFYTPSVPRGRDLAFELIKGEGLDVDSYTARAPRETPKPLNTPKPVPVGISELQKIIKAKAADVYELLESHDGIAPQGMQDVTINTVASKLVFMLPDGTPAEAIYELMRPCLNVTQVNPGDEQWPHDKARASIARAKERREVEEAMHRHDLELRNKVLREASAAGDGDTQEEYSGDKYTDEQVEKWAKEQGCANAAQFQRRWIIHKGTSYYIFVNGKYKSAVGKEDLQNTLQRDLSRAPVEITKQTKSATLPLKGTSILANYGTVAREIEANLALQASYYDAKTQTFFEAACPRRPIKPAFNKDVQRWLELMGSDAVNWVAAVTQLDRQCAALYLHGGRNSGKTLLATGLARLWTAGGATPMESIVNGFNDRLKKCPLIFADEQLPPMPNKSVYIRQLIGTTHHNLREMYRSAANLVGSPRVLITANNDGLFNTTEELTMEDLAAYAERVIYVHLSDDVGKFLAELVSSGQVMQRWIDEDIIAAHALWLRENHTFAHGRRYIVEGKMNEFHQRLALNSGLTAHVAEWISRHIIESVAMKVKGKGPSFVVIGGGEVLVSTSAMVSKMEWEAHMPGVHPPSGARISKTLRQLSMGTVTLGNITYYRLNTDVIKHMINQLALQNTKAALERIDAPVPNEPAVIYAS